MGLLFRLLLSPKTARAFYYWMMGIWVFVGEFNLDKFQRWQEQPPRAVVAANDAGMAPW